MELQKTLKQAAEHLSKHDPLLGSVISGAPIPSFKPHHEYYRELVESIISQQLSVKAAATILKRFRALFGTDFPAPEEILEKDVEELRSVGLSRQKATYIQDLARRVLDGSVKFDHLDALDNQGVIDELIQIKGVGLWTVHMFLMFCMARLDVLPTGDLGIRNGVQRLYSLTNRPDPQEVERIAKENNWHPYESVASWYIWHSLDNMPPVEEQIDL